MTIYTLANFFRYHTNPISYSISFLQLHQRIFLIASIVFSIAIACFLCIRNRTIPPPMLNTPSNKANLQTPTNSCPKLETKETKNSQNTLPNSTIQDDQIDESNFHKFEKAAELNDRKAQVMLGEYYLFKFPFLENYATHAIYWLKRAADANDLQGIFALAYAYETGPNEIRNKQYFSLYQKAAEQGHLESLYRLGYCYKDGKGTKKDPDQALRCFLEAANKNLHIAQWTMSSCYKKGLLVEKDLKEALKWYQIQTNSGNEYGKCYLDNDCLFL